MTLKDTARRWLKEPLVHFLIAGAAVFWVMSGRPPDLGERRIVVDEAVVTGLMQRFHDSFRRLPTTDEMDGLIRDYVADQVYYREALRLGLRQALLADPRVLLMGEDVGRYGGTYAVSKGLLDEFGPHRVRDTPLSESGFVGCGIGAAINGLRPIVEVMTVNFSLLALDQIVNTAALYRHMSGGQFAVPLVVRCSTSAGSALDPGPCTSRSVEPRASSSRESSPRLSRRNQVRFALARRPAKTPGSQMKIGRSVPCVSCAWAAAAISAG